MCSILNIFNIKKDWEKTSLPSYYWRSDDNLMDTRKICDDLNINYDDVYYVTFAGSINIVVKKTSKIPEKYPKWATITRGSELKFHYQ
jgi:hypothetical protein